MSQLIAQIQSLPSGSLPPALQQSLPRLLGQLGNGSGGGTFFSGGGSSYTPAPTAVSAGSNPYAQVTY